jgi:hypothetical protein
LSDESSVADDRSRWTARFEVISVVLIALTIIFFSVDL